MTRCNVYEEQQPIKRIAGVQSGIGEKFKIKEKDRTKRRMVSENWRVHTARAGIHDNFVQCKMVDKVIDPYFIGYCFLPYPCKIACLLLILV